MKSLNKLLPLFLFFLIPIIANSQNIITVNTWSDFEFAIQIEFFRSSSGLNQEIQNKIKKEFRKYNFSGKKYNCEYSYNYLIYLDSCGQFESVKLLKPYSDKKLKKFGTEVEKIISNSGIKILNNVHLIDTSYVFKDGFLFKFNTSCEPKELIFFEEPRKKEEIPIIIFKINELETIYFKDFTSCQY
jgi:hypothetical protein